MPSIPITNVSPRIQYVATLGQLVFNVPFIFFAATDLVVYYTPVNTVPNDVANLIQLTTNYTVTQNPVSLTGIITLNAGPNAGDIITIVRATPYQRLGFYIPGFGNFTPDAVNTDFETEVLMIQQNNMYDTTVMPRYNLSASPIVPNDTVLPILGPNQQWAKNAAGTAFVAVDVPPSTIVVPTTANSIAMFTDTIGTLASSAALITAGGTISNAVWGGAIIPPPVGGTGVNNGASTITLGGSLSTVGAFTAAFTMTGNTAVTFPTSGTLATTAGASGIVNPGLINQLGYYAAAGSAISALATANNGVLITSAGGVPSIGGTLPLAVQNTITQLTAVTMSSTLTLAADPTLPLQAATKQYVDALAAGLTFKDAVVAATTTALTVVYANGAAGVGATLTNAGAQAAFSTDGVTPAINSRILVKNQASTFQNGIYTLTTVGSGATNWVLTRAVDFDTPAEIQPGSFIIVQSGTTLVNTAWIQGATVVTVGTDPITFSQLIIAGGVTNVTASSPLASSGGSTPNITVSSSTGTGAIVLTTTPTITTPKIITSILDTNSNTLITLTPAASAVNNIQVGNSATGNRPGILAVGSDAVITLALAGKGGGGVELLGVTTGLNVTAGYVGELISSVIASGSAVSLTTGTAKNLTSITLTPGDWDISGNVFFNGSTANLTNAIQWCSLTTASVPDSSLYSGMNGILTAAIGGVTPYLRVNVAGTTTVFISGFCVFATGTASMNGGIYARRVR